METSPSTAPESERGSAFPLTHWSLIFGTGSKDTERARRAMEKLCGLYRQPIVNWFGRHEQRQEAEDLAHSFIEYLLAKEVLSQLTERKGTFRAFLVTCMRRFLYGSWDKAQAQKRGGAITLVPLDDEVIHAEQPGTDNQFDLDLALEVHVRVMKQLAPGRELMPYLFSKDTNTGWESIALALKTKPAALRQKMSRPRRAHWEAFSAEVAQIVSPIDKADETHYLYELLIRNLPPEPSGSK